jgi:Restriction endonuclease
MIVVVIAALFLGFVVIGFISRFGGNVPRVDSRADDENPDGRPTIPPGEFEDTIRGLFRALGLDVLAVSTDDRGTLEMTCRDPRPVSGGRLLVRASRLTAEGQVDAADVLAFAHSVRGDMQALKGIDIAVAGFTDEAYAASGAAPALVELIDAPRLLDLVREFVPSRAEALERYRLFTSESRRHSRAPSSYGAGNAPDLLPH